MMSDADFERAWVILAREGSCDEPGGAEHNRVKDEWIAADRPEAVLSFIVHSANRGIPKKHGNPEAAKKHPKEDAKTPQK